MPTGDELLESGRDARRELTGPTGSDSLLEDRETRTFFLLAVMDQELAQHADTRRECSPARWREEQALEREAEDGVLFERAMFGSLRAVRERIDQLLFGERMTDDFVGERSNHTALRCFLGSVEEIDDTAMLLFENVFER